MAITKQLTTAFLSLPDTIRDWVSSEEITSAISELNQELKISDIKVRIIPKLILRLVTQDLDPRDFINELGSQLKINYEAAKNLTQKIHNQALKPIEVPLKKMGVDAHQMLEYSAPPLASLKTLPDTPIKQTTLPAEGLAKTRSTQKTPEIAAVKPLKIIREPKVAPKAPDNLPIAPSKIKPVSPDKPFLLHQEGEEIKPSGKNEDKPSFIYNPPIKETESAPPPVKVEVESPPADPLRSEASREVLRVVHYSNFLTSLNQPNIKNNKIKIPKSRWFI